MREEYKETRIGALPFEAVITRTIIGRYMGPIYWYTATVFGVEGKGDNPGIAMRSLVRRIRQQLEEGK